MPRPVMPRYGVPRRWPPVPGGLLWSVMAVALVIALVARPAAALDRGAAADLLDRAFAAAPPVAIRPHLTVRPCAGDPGPAARADCYWAVLPGDWERDTGRVRLPVLVLTPVPAPPAAALPLVHVLGGPGLNGLGPDGGTPADWAAAIAGMAWIGRRPVVIYDQRGAGLADPALACPALRFRAWHRMAGHRLYSTRDLYDDQAVQRARCAADLQARGIDLAWFDTVASARDLAALRRLLGYDRWIVAGTSYGSRLGLELLRQDGRGVAAMLLAGLDPAGSASMARLVRALVDGLHRAAPPCDGACPAGTDLLAAFEAGLRGFARRPRQAAYTDPDTGATLRLLVDSVHFVDMVREALNRRSGLPTLAGLVTDRGASWTARTQQAFQGKLNDLAAVRFTVGATWTIDCNDNGDPDPMQRDGLVRQYPLLAPWITTYVGSGATWCGPWRRRASRLSAAPVRSAVPVLALEGVFDQATPPLDRPAPLSGLTRLYHVVLDGAGHDVIEHPCAVAVAAAFMAAPDRLPSVPCLAAAAVPAGRPPGR